MTRVIKTNPNVVEKERREDLEKRFNQLQKDFNDLKKEVEALKKATKTGS